MLTKRGLDSFVLSSKTRIPSCILARALSFASGFTYANNSIRERKETRRGRVRGPIATKLIAAAPVVIRRDRAPVP